jgi:hypothetical protein
VFPKQILNLNNDGGGGGGWLFPGSYGQKGGAHVSSFCDVIFMTI